MLEAAGHSVHVYTSPHLVRFNERIRLRGRIIEEAHLLEVLERAELANGGLPITYFEITTVAAFLAFSETPADILLLETGLGGRLDATNMVERPLAAVITPVSLDHQQYLGEDLASIAAEKAGIIKPGAPVLSGPQEEAAMAVIESRAQDVAAPLYRAGRDWRATRRNAGAGWAFESLGLPQSSRTLHLPPPGLIGASQMDNAALAVACLKTVSGLDVGDAALATGLTQVDWPARMQRIASGHLVHMAPRDAEIWLDGGHNPAAARTLIETLESLNRTDPRPLVLVAGMLSTKDAQAFLGQFAGPQKTRSRSLANSRVS
jgi:dihydrofolate synthase/folylpolyglutamate synthase